MAESLIIIGAGIAGLGAGCYGRMNGYDTHIFELHDKPGGLCTSWTRKGYVFDGCINWLVGTNPDSSINDAWKELGALKNCDIINHDEFFRMEGLDGKALIFYTDVDKLEKHMKELSPKDSHIIEEFIDGIRSFSKLDPPLGKPGLLEGIALLFKMIPFMRTFKKWGRISIPEYAKKFSDPFLRSVFALLYDTPEFPVLAITGALGWMNARNGGYPIGGSLEFSRNIEKRYLDLGGEISYRSRVEKILIKDGKAVGVRLKDGTEHKADMVISAADGHATIFDMLDGKYINDTIRGYYRDMPVFPPLIQISLGVARDLSSEPHFVNFPLEESIEIAGKTVSRLEYRHYCYDRTLAPPGKSVVVSEINTDYDYWKALHDDKDSYMEEKTRIADYLISELNKRFPGLKEDVEAVDVATPVTYERYTGNWKASYEGWLMTTENSKLMIKGIETTLPGLENFYMAGQWVKPGGGISTAALSGRETIIEICKKDSKKFKTSTP